MKKARDPVLILFSLTLFLSAALMFGLQPMVGKMLLPLVGGTPSGWIVAMAFFQVMLLAGYFLAHALAKFEPRLQGVFYLLCLGLGLFFLPVRLAGHTALIGSNPMAFDTFVLLTATVAIPFVALSATASTLQRLFATTGHTEAESPYFLYAASNLGSFTGLLLYPFLIEPATRLTMQSQGWLIGYILLIFFGAACLLMAKKMPRQKAPHDKLAKITWAMRGEWLLLAFFPSSLLLALTTYITVDIFSAPLVWVLPLSLYLLTFVIAFGRRKIIPSSAVLILQPICTMIALFLVYTAIYRFRVTYETMLTQIFAFTVIALMCHMRLAQKCPPNQGRQLTEFYLMLALGGALGGILNAFIIPLLLNRLLEYPVMLALSFLLHPAFSKKLSRAQKKLLMYCAAGFVLYLILHLTAYHISRTNLVLVVSETLLLGLMLAFSFHPRLALVISVIMIFIGEVVDPSGILALYRNFYGTIKIYDMPYRVGNNMYTARYMTHGVTAHGLQILDKKYANTPVSYYTPAGPIGSAILAYAPKKIAVLGLGTGTLSCYSTPQNDITFFEIDKDVLKVAKEDFTFLSSCGTGKQPRVIIGDGRLELARRDGKYDLIVLDAFSSDSIPTHLLTADAMRIYTQHLQPGGLILFHLSNRYFNLPDPVIATARSIGLSTRFILYAPEKDPLSAFSVWVAAAEKDSTMNALNDMGWANMEPQQLPRPWTDDYTNLLGTLYLLRL